MIRSGPPALSGTASPPGRAAAGPPARPWPSRRPEHAGLQGVRGGV